MRHPDLFASRPWLRAAALAGVAVLGLIGIVGSGGGSLGLPGDCPPGLDCSAPPPAPDVVVEPAYVTALVGAAVTFTARPSNFTGTVTYQWSRSSDGGATYTEIAGATGKSYKVPSVNLADDAARYQVIARGDDTIVGALGRLVVSATPGLVFQDGEFQPSDWLVTPFGDDNAGAPEHTEQRLASGGNPDAFLKMTYRIAKASSAGRVFYTSLAGGYEPQVQGAINVIDYAEDGIVLTDNALTSTESAMLLEQAGRRYLANLRTGASNFLTTSWSKAASQSSLRAQDFNLFDGPPCAIGESCPDFSASGSAMRFGYWRISFGTPGDSTAHGIDNWKVTVWRR
jgi:hypothetical protein